MANVINDKTLVPIFYVAVTLATVVGAIAWLTEIRSLAKTNTDQILKLERVVIDINNSLASYRTRLWESIRTQDKRLARIEGKLDVLLGSEKR